MPFRFAVASLDLTDGTKLEPPQDGMTIFFGPNNSGKSLLLRELSLHLNAQPRIPESRKWIDVLHVERAGELEDLLNALHQRGYMPREHDDGEFHYPGPPSNNSTYTPPTIQQSWTQGQFGGMPHFFWSYQGTEQRLGDHTQTPMLTDLQMPNHPVQQLSNSLEEHAAFSRMVERAFGEKVSINRYNQQQRLLVGETRLPDEAPPISEPLRLAYNRLPGVVEQGDGFRAFVNVLLQSVVRPAPVIIIDEPEAFLHPPQARLLGRYLAERVPAGSQVFVATHSSDFLAGVLEAAGHRRVALVRLAPTEGRRNALPLAPDAVAELLNTPLLRYSNIISGLFHDGVVLCEADTDCQFYAATSDVVRGDDGPASNLVFLHVSGKARLADTAHKLRQCGLPVAVIADLDLIRDAGQFKAAIQLLGGNWADVESDAKTVNQHANSVVINNSAKKVLDEIKALLGSPKETDALTTEQSQKIAELVKNANGWTTLKQGGLGVLSGDAYAAVERLLQYGAGLGLFLVPVGELEMWVRKVPSGNKKAWFNRVFSDGHWRNPTQELRDFVMAIEDYARQG